MKTKKDHGYVLGILVPIAAGARGGGTNIRTRVETGQV